MSKNPAAIQGWVKSVDPNSGREFYANHITRKTQWETPENWVDEPVDGPATSRDEVVDGVEPLPSNWEVMRDPTSGKPFYVDHERKITQWTRPTTKNSPSKKSFSAKTRAEESISSPGFLDFGKPYQSGSYSHEASYYPRFGGADVDFSDSLPHLDFSVRKVADKLRLNCSACGVLFTLSMRRHHCRLCGDVFCNNCSSNRVSLPMEGPEYEKPVRICDLCNEDVAKGNFFSMRRYLTPLQLLDPDNPVDDDPNGVASPANVNAALSNLSLDLDQMVQGTEGLREKLTISAELLVPCLTKHLSATHGTSDRAIRAIASLLSVGSMAGKNDYSCAIYLHDGDRALNQILTILERSGSDKRTLFAQEKAAQAMFYLTEPQVLCALVEKNNGYSHPSESDPLNALDIQRSVRNMLDHSSVNKNPHLQRWATATIRNLVLEDQRQSCLAINEIAAHAASGEALGSLAYESILDQLVSTGGVMILCSLIGADDADTRAHATGALGTILTATRAIDGSMSALYEMTAGAVGRSDKKDGSIVRAIVAGGGCGASVSQLLLSADNTVARMGCGFIASLVLPLLEDPLGSATLESFYDCRKDASGFGASREASLEIANGSCLPAILSLIHETDRVSRPIELRKLAMETLASIALAIGEMGKAWANGTYEEGMERNGAPAMLIRALSLFNKEQVVGIALNCLNSSSVQSLGSSRDTTSSRIREAAGVVLGSLTSCSAEAIIELQSRQILSQLLSSSDDTSMTAPSVLRGDAAPRCLGILEAASSILTFTWQNPSRAKSELLDYLIETLDAGTITHLFRVMTSKMDWESRDNSAGGMKARSAACRILCCLFGIALTVETKLGVERLLGACDIDQMGRRGSKGVRNVFEAVLSVLQTSLTYAHRLILGSANRGAHYQAALMDLVDASLLATGSMCGCSVAPGGGNGIFMHENLSSVSKSDKFATRSVEVCKIACDVVIRSGRSGPALLPTLLIGGFGERAVDSSLRLAVAIAQNGSKEQHMKLALSGILVPVSDILRAALSRGDLYRFSVALALVRFCGPHVAAGKAGGVQAVRDTIRIATSVLTLPLNVDASIEQVKTREVLMSECIGVLESLSANSALWSAICSDALPSIVNYLQSCSELGSDATGMPTAESAALRTVLEIVQVPSHAAAAAEAGLSNSLGQIIKKYTHPQSDECQANWSIALLAMETLHSLITQPDARRHCNLLDGSALSTVCGAAALAMSTTTAESMDDMNDFIFFGLEILSMAVSDIEASTGTAHVLQSPEASTFLNSIVAEPTFVRGLCASILPDGIKADQSEQDYHEVPPLYGKSPPIMDEACGVHQSSQDCVIFLLFTVSVYACALDSPQSDSFWNICLLRDNRWDESTDFVETSKVSAAFCSAYLQLLEGENEVLAPFPNEKQSYGDLKRQLVRYRILEALGDSLSDLTRGSNDAKGLDDYTLSLLASYKLPSIFLSVWKDPALLELTYELLKIIVEADQQKALHLFVMTKSSVVSLFDLLNYESDSLSEEISKKLRQLLVSILGKLAEAGLLVPAVEKFEIKSSAIQALASACLSEEFVGNEEELTSSRLANGLIQCLAEVCSVVNDSGGTRKREVVLTDSEAETIAYSLGRKICHMVISRYLERAKLQQYDLAEDDTVLHAPDVSMLCAMAQHTKAFNILNSIGGLHALAQVVADGEPNALAALLEVSKSQPLLLLEADTYVSVLCLFSDRTTHKWKSDPNSRDIVEARAFHLLSLLGDESSDGRRLICKADGFQNSISRAQKLLSLSCQDNETERKMKREKESITSDGSQNDTGLLVAALAYVAAMTKLPEACALFLDDKHWVETISNLAESSRSIDLQVSALKVIAGLAKNPRVDGSLTIERVGDIFQAVLRTEQRIEADMPSRANELYSLATEGILFLFDSFPTEKRKSIIHDAVLRFQKLLKNHTINQTASRVSEFKKAGEVAYNITSIIMIASYSADLKEIVDSNLIVSLVNALQWRYDPRTEIEEAEQCAWDASVTQILQILSRTVFQTDGIFSRGEFSLHDLKKIVLMVARPGKAPREAISFADALQEVQKFGDPASKLAASRITRSLEK